MISQAATDGADPDRVGEVANVYGEGPADPQARTMREIRALFDGWELLDPPGLADVRQWAGGAAPGPGRLRMPGGIAIKPLWHITGVTEHFEVNRANWDERVPAHVASPDYAVQRFASDPAFLSDVVRFDLPLLGDISGLRGVHLQCHIGTDTISLARLGASMTGLDFSAPAVAAARELAAGTGADAAFVAGEVYAAPGILGRGGFDLVYTGIGALCWLPDIRRWARVVAALLRPGGRLFIREGHPVLWALDDERADDLLVLRYPYYERAEPLVFDQGGTYVRTDVEFQHNVTHEWNHGLGEIMTALLDAGLSITAFTEHDSVPWDALPGKMERIGGGEFRLADDPSRLPHSYTLQAVKRPG